MQTTARQNKKQSKSQDKENKKDKIWENFKSLQGSLADVEEFKGMSSVDLQHYITRNLW